MFFLFQVFLRENFMITLINCSKDFTAYLSKIFFGGLLLIYNNISGIPKRTIFFYGFLEGADTGHRIQSLCYLINISICIDYLFLKKGQTTSCTELNCTTFKWLGVINFFQCAFVYAVKFH